MFRHCPRPLFHFFLIIATWYCSRLSNIDDTVHTEEEEEEEGSKNGSKENPSWKFSITPDTDREYYNITKGNGQQKGPRGYMNSSIRPMR